MRICAMFAAMLVAAAPSAFGGFIGLTGVVVDYRYPNLSTTLATDTVSVGPGVEITCPTDPFSLCGVALTASRQTLDIGDWTIRYDYVDTVGNSPFHPGFSAGTFGGLVFSNLDVGGSGITGLTLATNMPGLDASRVSFTTDSVSVNLQSLDLFSNTYFELTASSSDMPEPSGLVLLGTGVGGLLLLRRRRANRSPQNPVSD